MTDGLVPKTLVCKAGKKSFEILMAGRQKRQASWCFVQFVDEFSEKLCVSVGGLGFDASPNDTKESRKGENCEVPTRKVIRAGDKTNGSCDALLILGDNLKRIPRTLLADGRLSRSRSSVVVCVRDQISRLVGVMQVWVENFR